jgi:hypothetical protein
MADEAHGSIGPPDDDGRELQRQKRQQPTARHHILVHRNNRTGSFRRRSKGDDLRHQDLAAASERDLLRLGKVVCDGLGIEGLGFRRVVEKLVRSEGRPTTTEARTFVRSAVRNLCPAQASATR